MYFWYLCLLILRLWYADLGFVRVASCVWGCLGDFDCLGLSALSFRMVGKGCVGGLLLFSFVVCCVWFWGLVWWFWFWLILEVVCGWLVWSSACLCFVWFVYLYCSVRVWFGDFAGLILCCELFMILPCCSFLQLLVLFMLFVYFIIWLLWGWFGLSAGCECCLWLFYVSLGLFAVFMMLYAFVILGWQGVWIYYFSVTCLDWFWFYACWIELMHGLRWLCCIWFMFDLRCLFFDLSLCVLWV